MTPVAKTRSAPTLRVTALACTLVVGALLSACGGSDGPGPKTETISLRVIGDDQGDSGSYGYKFTVQNSDHPSGFPIFTELVAASLRAPAVCNHYSSVNGSVQFATNPNCSSYAIAGSRINYQPTLADNLRALPILGQVIAPIAPPTSAVGQILGTLPGLGSLLSLLPQLPLVGGVIEGIVQALPGVSGTTTPLSILTQLKQMGDNGGFSPKDLTILIAGSNDAADLATAFLQASIDQGIAFNALTGSLGIATEGNRLSAGNNYMVKLADMYYAAIRTHLLDKGATRLAILNIPNINQTPRLAQARGKVAGAEAAQPVFLAWVNTFNGRLKANIGNDKRFVQVDYMKLLNDEITDSVSLLVSNTGTPICPSTGNGALDMLPTYNLKTCTSAMLSANIPAGETSPNWWKSYAFADSVHASPYTHNLLARGVNLELIRAGIL